MMRRLAEIVAWILSCVLFAAGIWIGAHAVMLPGRLLTDFGANAFVHDVSFSMTFGRWELEGAPALMTLFLIPLGLLGLGCLVAFAAWRLHHSASVRHADPPS